MKKRKLIWSLTLTLAILMPTVTAMSTTAQAETTPKQTTVKYESPDINYLTGAGQEPEDFSVSAVATYQEKAWYEYVVYSEHPVSSYRLDDNTRLVFYDPYTYTNSLIMEVNRDTSTLEFDTMSEYSVSHTNTRTISACSESTYTNTTAIQESGRDVTHSEVKNEGTTKTLYNHSVVNKTTGTATTTNSTEYKKLDWKTESLSESIKKESKTGIDISATTLNIGETIKEEVTLGGTTTGTINFNSGWFKDYDKSKTVYSDDYSTSTNYVGDDTVEYDTNSTTEGWTELSARVTKTIGSSTSTSKSWSESEGTTVTRTYAATHFASDGVTPLPWAIVHYQVLMPMKCEMQLKVSGEWVPISTVYCLLTTVQGTCRTWMQQGQAYYEDWGSGEPVVEAEFWSGFMTREGLMSAYQNRLYPTGGK